MNHKDEQQPTERVTSRRLLGAPPSAAAMRIAAKTSKNNDRKRKHSAIEEPTEEEESDEEIVEKTSHDMQDEEDSKQVGEETTDIPNEKKRKRRKRRIRLTDQGLKAKRKAERREKLLAEKKEREDYQSDDEEDEVDCKQLETNGRNEAEEKQKPPQQKVRPPPETLTPFQLFCDNILRKLVQKDPEGYFMHPVSEVDAPDYKKIIEVPMDFSTIRDKIEQNLYENISDFQADVELITINAQLYNSPGSLFFIAAQKLGVLTRYYFSEKYLTYLVYVLPFGRTVPTDKIGIITQKQVKERGRHRNELNIERGREKMRSLIKDHPNSKELIEALPKEIKNRLAMRRPNCHIAYLDNQDGAIALNVLTPAICEESKFKLGDWIKPLEKGTPGICTPFEPLVGQDFLMSYTNPGPYSSFAPQYDSTWATLSKRDSDLLLSCYGDKDNVVDALALRQMVANAGEATSSFVEEMLNEITDGEHGRTIALMEQKDVEKIPHNPFDEKLRNTGQKIQELAKIQDKRLSRPPPPTLSHTVPPDMYETQLAAEIIQDLGSQVLEMDVRPRDIVSTRAVHQALGLDAADLEILSEFLEV